MRVAITGATGFVGIALCKALKKLDSNINILPLGRKAIEILPGLFSTPIDLVEQYEDVEKVLTQFQPQIIVQLAAVTIYNPPPERYDYYHQLNTQIPYKLSLLAQQLNALSVYTSSDMVFDGSNTQNTPDSPTNPITIYGISKKNAEDKLIGKNLVIRFPWIMGMKSPYFNQIYTKLMEGSLLELFDNEFHSVILIDDAVTMFLELILKSYNLKNVDFYKIWHIAGPQPVCRYDIGVLLVQYLNLDKNLIKPIHTQEVFKDVRRPGYVGLDSTATYQLLNFTPRSPEEAVKEMLKEVMT